MTYMSKSARRVDSCVLVTPPPSFRTQILSNRAKAVSIFPFVIGDLCQRMRLASQQGGITIPRGVSEVCQRKTGRTGCSVSSGVEGMIDEKPYSQFADPIVHGLLLRELSHAFQFQFALAPRTPYSPDSIRLRSGVVQRG